MVEARQAPEGSRKRLNGKLMLLINDEWALTSAGLEGIESDHFFQWELTTGPRLYIPLNEDGECPSGCQDHLWEEAKYYALRMMPEY